MDQKSSKPSLKRRAILQGSLAAPLVLTVSSAGAQTALSSARRALEKLKTQQPSKSLYFQDSPDNWFRTRVPIQVMQNTAGEQAWYYADPRGMYYKVKTLTGASAFEDMTGKVLTPTLDATDFSYLLVWVDDEGRLAAQATAEPIVSGLIACTCSAINSVRPGACPPTA